MEHTNERNIPPQAAEQDKQVKMIITTTITSVLQQREHNREQKGKVLYWKCMGIQERGLKGIDI